MMHRPELSISCCALLLFAALQSACQKSGAGAAPVVRPPSAVLSPSAPPPGSEELARIKGHGQGVTHAAINSAGTNIVLAYTDGSVRFWAADGTLIRELKGHDKGVARVAFSPDGKIILTTGGDGTVRLWDRAGKEVVVFEGRAPQGRPGGRVVSADGRSSLTFAADGSATVWRVKKTRLSVLSSPAPAPAGRPAEVKVVMYVMSRCPFGVQAIEGFLPVLDELDGRVRLDLEYIVTEKGGGFEALHGQPEVEGNINQLCARKHAKTDASWLSYIGCVNRDWRKIPTNWKRCAEEARIPVEQLRACKDGNEGKALLRASMKRAQAANAKGSPTIKVAGAPYKGGRSRIDFLTAICEKLTGSKPGSCARIPQEPVVTVTVITDRRCKKCTVDGLISNLRDRFFKKLKVRKLDYSQPEAKRLYGKLKLQSLPVFLFDPDVARAPKYPQVKRWMLDVGNYKKLQVPASFDPTAEICDNNIDDTGNGKVDCADSACKPKLACRKAIPGRVEVFVMSQCPFGVKALDAMKEVLAIFKGQISFDVHYIADRTSTGFNALHGQPEVDENIRHLCAKKLYRKRNRYMKYIWCRNKNYRSSDWKPCAKRGISARRLERCAGGGQGERLLAADIKIAKSLDISGSPTWLVNNRYKFSGIRAEAIYNAICARNKKLPACKKKVKFKAPDASSPPGSCSS